MAEGLSSPQPWDDQRYNAQEEAAPQEVELDTLVGIFKKGHYIEVHPIEQETRDPNFDAGENKIVFSIPPVETENSSFIPQVGKNFMVLAGPVKITANRASSDLAGLMNDIVSDDLAEEIMNNIASLGSVELIKQLKKGIFRVVTFQGGQEHYFLVKTAQPRSMH